jgi:Carboxypeptidase regulatory-like domain/TonB-dependent Receptor Plug Domain
VFNASAIRSPRWFPGVLSRVCGSFLLLCCASALIPIAQAQTTGALSGTVRDTTKSVIPGATLTLVNTVDSKSKRATTSNGEGFFSINAIQPGTYNLTVSMKGFDRYKVTGIEVHPGDNVAIASIAMKIGRVEEEVTVSATAAGVNLDSPEKSSLITADDIQRLSTVGRDATELIKFLPGFAVNGGGSLANGSTNNNSQTMGFGSSSVSSFSANGATGQTGATTVIQDGGSVMDPGDMGASISNVNMDMVQEIKVQTSNFGADSAKGPVVINAVGKSGGSSYHGTAYVFTRNGSLNANDWLNNNTGVTRPNSYYYFPGANIGGPVLIPGTNFNHNRKMTFFAAFEDYDQNVFQQLLTAFIPTMRTATSVGMIGPGGGDLSPGTIAKALNVDPAMLLAQCPNDYTSGTLSSSDGICYSPGYATTTYTQQDQQIVAGTVVGGGLLPIDPRAAIYEKFWPTPNHVPTGGNGLISNGFNYVKALTATNNGYQAHARIDQNFTDNTKLYVTYNLEKINSEQPLDNTFYAGNDPIPYPTPLFSHTYSDSLAVNFTHVFGPTLTNEFISAGTYFYSPNQLQDPGLVSDASTGWTGGSFYNNKALQLPGIVDYENGVPDFAMGYVPPGSAFLRKFSYNGADNITKQIRTHSIKAGIYAEVTANNQVPFAFAQGENAFNHYDSGCVPNDGNVAHLSQLMNNVANFLQGCSDFQQSSVATPANLHFRSLDFYVTDEWKATKKLTLTLGMRFEHLGAWFNPDGVGLAVWNAPEQHVFYPGVTQDAHTYPGISWHQTDPRVPISGQPTTPLFYSPRVGLAYDLYGNGKTVLRGGWGAYRFHDSYNDSAGPLSTTLGIQNFIVPTNVSCTYAQLTGSQNGVTTPGQACVPITANAPASPFSITALDQHDTQQPVTYNYNFTIDQVMPYNSNIEISYVGNQSHHTFTEGNLSNQNYIPLGGLFQPDPLTGAVSEPSSAQQVEQDYFPYPNYLNVFVPHHIGYGNYNSLQASWNRQKGAFIYGVNYTWAKALGIRGDYRTGAVGDPSTLRNNYGYLGFNRAQALNFHFSWIEGNLYHGNRVVRDIVNQWELSGITGLQSGPDVAVLDGANFGLAGGVQFTSPGSSSATVEGISNTNVLGTPSINLQPKVTCDPKFGLHNSTLFGKQFIQGNCFALPALGTNGSFELPNVEGPAYFNSDLTVQRTVQLREKQNLQFRLSGFNFLNHPLYQFYNGAAYGLTLNYGDPTGFVGTTPQQAIAAATQNMQNFGSTPYKGGFRIVELSARYNF